MLPSKKHQIFLPFFLLLLGGNNDLLLLPLKLSVTASEKSCEIFFG